MPALADANVESALHAWTTFETPWGWTVVVFDDRKLIELSFGHASPVAARKRLGCEQSLAAEPTDDLPAWVDELAVRLVEFAGGATDDFRDVAIDTSHLTPLGKKIIAACRRIPFGKVLSYKEVAQKVGRPGAARAVGNVMAANRFPLVVPCHRVVGSAGSLGGYSAPGGLATKRELLRMEGSLSE